MRIRIVLSCLLAYVTALGVMSIDMGSEWFKVAIVKPGVPMDIVLNKESQRKTAVAIYFRNGERSLGADAEASGNLHPRNTYKYFPLLLGKSISDPAVEDYRAKFPYHKIVPTERNTVAFETIEVDSDGNPIVYSIESLMAMILSHAREMASTYAESVIADAVINVPSTWSQAERLAMKQAAEMGGIKLHQLMNDNIAVALHYGVFNRKEIESKPMNIVFFDMGASTTTVSIVQYQVIKGKHENAPQVSVKGVGNAPVGGLKVDFAIRDLLVEKWEAVKKTDTDIKTQKSGRAMAKLLTMANKVKTVLSANRDTTASVQNLVDDEDFKASVSRDELEKCIQEDIVVVMDAVKEAFKTSGITLDEIKKVIMFGGGQRIPAIQKALREELGGKLDLSFSINSDEAAALGGSYQSAFVTKLFRVKTIWLRDGALEPIFVKFEREVDPEENEGESVKEVKRTLFQVMNPYPQKKAITFNRFYDDFSFTLFVGNNRASQTDIKGVKSVIEEHNNATYKGAKAHFRMDDSGVINLESVEAVFEIEVTEEEVQQEEEKKLNSTTIDKSTLDALKEKFADLFKENNFTGEEFLKEASDNIVDKSESDTKDTTEEANSGENEETSNEEKIDANQTVADEKPSEGSEPAIEDKPAEPVFKTFSKPLEFDQHIYHVMIMGDEERKQVTEQLKKLEQVDAEKKMMEESQNNLESFIVDMQYKLTLEGWTEMLSSSERDELSALFSSASDWLWDAEDPKVIDFQDKLSELKRASRAWSKRVTEFNNRPEAIEKLQTLISKSITLMGEDLKNRTGEGLPLSAEDIESALKKVDETKAWLEEKINEQIKVDLSEDPILTISDIQMKERILYNNVDSLIKKVKKWRPPKIEVKDKKASKASKTKDAKNETTTESDEKVYNITEPTPEPTPESTSEETVTHDASEL